MIKKALKMVFNSNYRFIILANKGLYNLMDDEEYIKRKYKAIFGTELDLENPKTYNQKIQWLKLYYRRPDYTKYVDKFEVRSYVAKTIGEEHLVPLLGVWDSPKDIDFDKLPSKFVLKCNHNSGLGMCICENKDELQTDRVISG